MNTLDGYKTISGGNVTIHLGSLEPAYPDRSLTIPLLAYDQDSLHLAKLTLLTSNDSSEAIMHIHDAITVIYTAMGYKINS